MENYLRYLKNPTEYIKNEKKMCNLINILVAHSQNLFNTLSKSEQDMIIKKHGPFNKTQSINQLNFISVLMNVKCSDEKMIQLIFNRFVDIYNLTNKGDKKFKSKCGKSSCHGCGNDCDDDSDDDSDDINIKILNKYILIYKSLHEEGKPNLDDTFIKKLFIDFFPAGKNKCIANMLIIFNLTAIAIFLEEKNHLEDLNLYFNKKLFKVDESELNDSQVDKIIDFFPTLNKIYKLIISNPSYDENHKILFGNIDKIDGDKETKGKLLEFITMLSNMYNTYKSTGTISLEKKYLKYKNKYLKLKNKL
jgi:hypothetical protein